MIIEIGMAIDSTKEERTIEKRAKKYNISIQPTNKQDPSGGWPVYRFTGTDANIRKFFHKWATTKEEMSELVQYYEVK